MMTAYRSLSPTTPLRCLLFALLLGVCSWGWCDSPVVTIDFSKTLGTIRPLHGVNGGPLVEGETVDLTEHWREAGIPFTRLHDVNWPRPDVVDFHAIFPSMDADPAQAENYTFAKTDDYIQSVRRSGTQIIFRLGESIEHSRVKYHVHPPRNPKKWAEGCAGIIRHYNHGWADGFRHDIHYWEIWNEPENRPAMWTGTDEEYFELYTTTAKRIKREFPDLKVGGPAVGSTGEFEGGKWQPNLFLERFLDYVKEHEAPLDFLSWHTYTNDPTLYSRKATAMRAWLDQRGFGKAELHLNEWNYLPDNDWSALDRKTPGAQRARWYSEMSSARGAGFLAYVLCDLQDGPVDVANVFTGVNGPFGLFTHHGEPQKNYYAFKAFNQLVTTGNRVPVTGSESGKWLACAGLGEDKKSAVILLAAYRDVPEKVELTLQNCPWKNSKFIVFRLDAEHDLVRSDGMEELGDKLSLPLEGPGVILVKIIATE